MMSIMHRLLEKFAAYAQSGEIRYLEPIPSVFTKAELAYLWDKGYITSYKRNGDTRERFLAIETENFED